jgi:type II secretory pathway component PulL
MARLALERHLRTAPGVARRYALLWRNEETIDLWLVERDRPVFWNWLPCEVLPVARALRHLALSEDPALPVAARHLPPDFLKASRAEAGLASVDLPSLGFDDPLVAATLEAAGVLEGQRAAAIELRRDQLAAKDRNRAIRSHLKLVLGAALLFLAALAIGLFSQARQGQLLRDEYEQRQTILFGRLFPKERVPIAIHARLQSELARLKGVRGERTDLPESTPFLAVLEPLLEALPADLRYRLLEVRIENGQLYLVGQVRAHGDADRIAEALRAAGLEVASPQTNRLEKDGVEFRISGRLARPDAKQPLQRAT